MYIAFNLVLLSFTMVSLALESVIKPYPGFRTLLPVNDALLSVLLSEFGRRDGGSLFVIWSHVVSRALFTAASLVVETVGLSPTKSVLILSLSLNSLSVPHLSA